MTLKMWLLMAVLGLAQRRVEVWREPWGHVMDLTVEQGDAAAQAELERLARGTDRPAWERAYALRWAGRLAVRRQRYADAERDFLGARREDPAGFEGALATVHLGEVAIRQRRWYAAERWLATVEHHRDPIVATYAQDRLRAVRERTRRLTARYVALAVLALAALALVVRTARRARQPGVLRSFARALLAGEAVALAGALLVPQLTTSLARPGWMAFAIPAALVGALLWATRLATPPAWQRAVVVIACVLTCAAGLYVALDWTWWSVARPVLQ